MCDTMCITADRSSGGEALFAKNSDRSPNEPHLVIHVPGKHHSSGSMVKCTYISIPQAEYTREMILFKPSWIWGAEMGINENRVVIGNEAVFTKSKKGAEALIGMDILRLALERSDSAASAVETMISLLETYGQGGNCGFDHRFFYDNSFLAADPNEAFILETSGKNYAVIKADKSYAISNRLTIGKDHSGRSGIAAGEDFSKCYTEPVYSHFSAAKERRHQVTEKLASSAGVPDLINILRSHNPDTEGKEFTRGSVNSVCMHGGGIFGDHTTGSLAAVLRPQKPVTLWCTGASTPCISAFKPVFWGAGVPPVFEDAGQSRAYWLKREEVHRAVIAGKLSAGSLRKRIGLLENEWFRREKSLMAEEKPDAALLFELSRAAAGEEELLINEFHTQLWRDIGRGGRYARYWNRMNSKL